jgi:site-specific DNA recombinase
LGSAWWAFATFRRLFVFASDPRTAPAYDGSPWRCAGYSGDALMENIFKVSLYIRVSTEKQLEGDSLEEQESELKKFCEYKKYLIHKIHIERGQSAKDTNRVEYQKLLADIKNKKINAIIVKKLDRLSRSLLDFEEFMRTAQEFNVEFISLRENFDTTNAIGKAMLRVALVFAQLEREQTAERISDVMTYRASQGLFNGGIVPYGYDVINKELIPHKQEKKFIQLMFNKFIETKSTTKVERELQSLGAKTRQGLVLERRTIQKMLCNTIYIGKIRWKNNVYLGVHQHLVTEDIFNKVQTIFQTRCCVRDSKLIKGLLRGLLFCGVCKSAMTPNYTKKKNGKIYFYYRCVSTLNVITNKGCKNKYLKMEKANQSIIDKLLEFSTETKLAEMEQEINNKNLKTQKEISVLNTELSGLESHLKDIKTKKDRYLDSLVSNNFAGQERTAINNKIEEFTLEEKQIKGNIYKSQLELSKKQSELISFEKFKEEIIFFKINQCNFTEKELENWLKKNIKRIYYSESNIRFEFDIFNSLRV